MEVVRNSSNSRWPHSCRERPIMSPMHIRTSVVQAASRDSPCHRRLPQWQSASHCLCARSPGSPCGRSWSGRAAQSQPQISSRWSGPSLDSPSPSPVEGKRHEMHFVGKHRMEIILKAEADLSQQRAVKIAECQRGSLSGTKHPAS